LIRELESKNQELEDAYRELKTTQVQLVHSAKMASLGQLVAGIAHEINNPLAYATSNLSTVTHWLSQIAPEITPGLSPEVLAKWEKIGKRILSASEGVDRVKDLVLKLRTFSRLDEGEFKTIEVPDTVESVLSFLEHRLGEITVVRDYRGPLSQLECFAGALNQVIMNLVANAIDALEGQGTITISTESDQQWFRITVADSGPGLPPGAEEKLFEPFYTTKPVGQGTGLGLSISFGIMQAHRGRIKARNRDEGGCEFMLEVPLDLGQHITPEQLARKGNH
jgi:two-component system NtrC family sensor kinase